MKFKLVCENLGGDKATLFYDNEINELSTEDGFIFETGNQFITKPYINFSPDNPIKKSKNIRVLKVQLGLSCNYSCDYCSQRFVAHAEETNKQDIESFLKKLDNLEFSEEQGLKIEMWGGEPFVYWKTMEPLTAELKKRFKDWKRQPQFSVITNGSLLTEEICDWLVDNNFAVSISHDGPGQHVRGPDPFIDPEKKATVLGLYNRLRPIGKMSFNCMMNGTNLSRKEVHKWFIEFTGDENVPLGEGSVVDAYDEGGLQNSLNTKKKHFEFRKTAFNDVFENEGNIGFMGQVDRIDDFTSSIINHVPASSVGQKCGMDLPYTIAVNLRGEVSTCQNVSPVQINSNGQSHASGNISNVEDIKITTSMHWSNRPNCSSCPVLHICKGSCMFLDGEFWDTSCENSFSDAIWVFALSIEKITGFIPVFIEADHLPDHRKDIWGSILEHKEKKPKKIIPISISN